MQRICFLLDIDMDGRLGQADLTAPSRSYGASVFVAAAKIDLSPPGTPLAPGKLIKLADAESGGLTCDHICLALVTAWGANGSEWKALFKAMGYDARTIRPTDAAALPFVVSMHSSQRLAMRLGDMPAAVSDATTGLVARIHGKPLHLGSCTVHALTTGNGAIFAGTNNGKAPATLKVDCSGSVNVHTSRGGLVCTTDLPAGGAPALCMGLVQKDTTQGWSFKYQCSTSFAQHAAPHAPADLSASFAAIVQNVEQPTSRHSGARSFVDFASPPLETGNAATAQTQQTMPTPKRSSTELPAPERLPKPSSVTHTPPNKAPAMRGESYLESSAMPAAGLAGLAASSAMCNQSTPAKGAPSTQPAATKRASSHSTATASPPLPPSKPYDPNYKGPIVYVSASAARQKQMLLEAREAVLSDREKQLRSDRAQFERTRKRADRGSCTGGPDCCLM